MIATLPTNMASDTLLKFGYKNMMNTKNWLNSSLLLDGLIDHLMQGKL